MSPVGGGSSLRHKLSNYCAGDRPVSARHSRRNVPAARLQRSLEQGLGSRGSVRERSRKPDIGAISGDEDEGNLQRVQPLGDRKALFAHQPDIEQGKIRRAIGNHFERPGDVSRGPHRLHAQNRECVSSKSSAMIGSSSTIKTLPGMPSAGCGFHNLASCKGSAPTGSNRETITSRPACLFTCAHNNPVRSVIVWRAGKRDIGMIARRGNAPDGSDRPYNNLLRRLSASDFALIAPHLAPSRRQAQRPALQSRRRCRDRAFSLRTEPGVLSGAQ